MKGIVCDNCGNVLAFDAQNGIEDEAGESCAWIGIDAGGLHFDACTRSCGTELLADGTSLAAAVDAQLAAVAEVVRILREDRDDDDAAGSS